MVNSKLCSTFINVPGSHRVQVVVCLPNFRIFLACDGTEFARERVTTQGTGSPTRVSDSLF